MIALSSQRTRALLAIHGWSGVLLGLLLYVVILTGALAVFADEIGDWASPLDGPVAEALPPGLDARIRELAAQIDPAYHEEMYYYAQAGGRIRVYFHHHVAAADGGHPQEMGVEFELHPRSLDVLARREGPGEAVQAGSVANALAEFIVHLHVSLHVPEPWGYLLTGVLGLAMLVAAVTGLVVHRHLLAELFTWRRWKGGLLGRRDAHVIAGSWNLPFAFVLAFTGSFYSFAGSLGIPIMAMVAFGGDQQALIETIVGSPPPEDTRAQPIADLDRIVADAQQRIAVAPSFVSVSHYGRADARVTVFALPATGAVFSHNLLYDGASGSFLQHKPSLGLLPSAGGTLVDLMAPLHFGNFAGWLSKLTWFALGLASVYVALSGLELWIARRSSEPAWQRMEGWLLWVGHGLPLVLASMPGVYFVLRTRLDSGVESALNTAFLLLCAGCAVLVAALADRRRLRATLWLGTALALLSAPLLRWLCGGPGWITAIGQGMATIAVLDVALIAAGLLYLRQGLRSSRHAVAPAAGREVPA